MEPVPPWEFVAGELVVALVVSILIGWFLGRETMTDELESDGETAFFRCVAAEGGGCWVEGGYKGTVERIGPFASRELAVAVIEKVLRERGLEFETVLEEETPLELLEICDHVRDEFEA